MNLTNITTLALRYLSGHHRRYIFLIMAISFGFAIITTMTSLSDGMLQNVYQAAQNHYGGQLFVLGFHKESGNFGLIQDDKVIVESINKAGINPQRILRRTLYFADGMLYFAGNSVRQKNIYGVDWNDERQDFQSMDFAAGNAEGLAGSNGILISEPVAKQLKIQVGDDLILKVNTKTGQKNTGIFIVRGIFRDTSIFGYYKCFIDRIHLNRLLGFKDNEYSSIGLFFNDRKEAEKNSIKLYNELKQHLPMAPFINSKEEYSFQLDQPWQDIRYFIMTLQLFVSQVSDLLSAMEIISYFLYLMMSLIILVSISVTYKLIIHERAFEIGTMRALGIQKKDIMLILIIEAFSIFLGSILIGSFVSLLVLWIISLFSYTWIPGFEIFMHKGKLMPHFSFNTIIINIFILVIITFPAFWIPSYKASRLKLTTALSEK